MDIDNMQTPVQIRLTNLTKSYAEGPAAKPVFQHVNAEIQRGEIIVLLGRSGSGKSTLLNLLSGIDMPSAGSIEIAGKTINTLSERDRTIFRRQHIGFVFQFFNLIPTLTVAENILLPLELNGFSTAESRKRVADMLREVGLPDRGDSFPEQLSGGEQQRVAIARALVAEPELVLADEPTGNLDKQTGLTILALLDRLVRQTGRTMVMATHSAEVMGMADRIMTFEDGALLASSQVIPQ